MKNKNILPNVRWLLFFYDVIIFYIVALLMLFILEYYNIQYFLSYVFFVVDYILKFMDKYGDMVVFKVI